MKKFVFIFLSLLFYVPFFTMFGIFGRRYYNWDGLAGAFYMFYYDLIVLVALIQFYIFRKTKYRIIYYTIYLLFSISMLSHFKSIISGSVTEPIDLLFPIVFCFLPLPIIALFWFIFRKFRFFYLYLLIFVSYPLYIIVMDEIDVYKFLKTCNETTPAAEYNPLYLPERFFHEDENGNKVPDIIFPYRYRFDAKYKGISPLTKEFYEEYKDSIINMPCDIFFRSFSKKDRKERLGIINMLYENNNIVLCNEEDTQENCPWFDDGSDTAKHLLKMSKNCLPTPRDINRFRIVRYKINKEMNRTPIAIFSSDYFVGSRLVQKYLIARDPIYCDYNKSGKNTPEYRKNDLRYENYIKPISKGENQQSRK